VSAHCSPQRHMGAIPHSGEFHHANNRD
jgi:hypothetical protein